jgi:hypothetical protein
MGIKLFFKILNFKKNHLFEMEKFKEITVEGNFLKKTWWKT